MDNANRSPVKTIEKISFKEILRKYNTIITLALVLMIAAATTGGKFFNISNVLTVIERASLIGIVALGQGLVILMGSIDLSVNAVMNISFVSLAALSHAGTMPYSSSIPIAFAMSILIGLFNGILIIKTRVPAWIITLSSMMMVDAITLTWAGVIHIRFPGLQEFINGTFGMTVATSRYFTGILWILLGCVFAVILAKTRFGLNMSFIGGGRRAAYLSGINIGFTQVAVYVISAVMACLAGILLAYRAGSLNPNSAGPYQLYSIAAVVLGGAKINGGEGSAFGAFFGAFILAILSNVLNILQVDIFIQNAIMGALLILIVALTTVLKKK